MLIEIAMGAAFVAATLAIWAVLRIAFDSGDRKVSRLERRLGLNEAEVDLEPVLPESEEGLGRTDRALRRLIHESGSPLDAGTAALLVLFWALAVGGSLFVLTAHLLAAADEFFSDIPGVSWLKPEGGLYVWMTVPESLDTGFQSRLFHVATTSHSVMYVPGEMFYPEGSTLKQSNQMRLSFGVESPETLREGMKRLAAAVRECLSDS